MTVAIGLRMVNPQISLSENGSTRNLDYVCIFYVGEGYNELVDWNVTETNRHHWPQLIR